MQLQATKKLCTYLKADCAPAEGAAPSSGALGEWYGNLIQVAGARAILFTNERTLLSFLIYEGKQRSLENIHASFVRGLFIALTLAQVPPDVAGSVAESYAYPLELRATSNRKVLGTMKEIALTFDHFIVSDGGLRRCDLTEITRRINELIWGAISYEKPGSLAYGLVMEQAQ